MKEALLIKTNNQTLQAATDFDAEILNSFKTGQAVKVKIVMQSARSLPHHRLYFAGLLQLAFDYWEPSGGLIAPSEKATLKKFCKWLDRKSNDSGAIYRAAKVFLNELGLSRAQSIEAPHKSKVDLHNWVKEQAGYYDLVITPSGIRKKVKSINFNKMGQEEFNEFYKKAFSVVWQFILFRTFESEEQAENVINNLLSMG